MLPSRNMSRLEPLKAKGAAIVRLDHNEPFENVRSAVADVVRAYGKVDIVVNNAAYVQTGMLEETRYDAKKGFVTLPCRSLGHLS